MIKIKISKSARKWGYVIWGLNQDEDIRKLLGDNNNLVFNVLGVEKVPKTIDWRYRRIGIRYSLSRTIILSHKYYVLKKEKDGSITISTSTK